MQKNKRLFYDLVSTFLALFSTSSFSEEPRRRSAPAAATVVTSTPAAAEAPATATFT
jgi:hypothetical protein